MTGQLTREHIGRAEATGLVAQLVRTWVDFYTGWVSAPAAERRRDEIHSDLWEQQTFAREMGVAPFAVAVSIARRAALGVPADLLWVRTERAALRSLPAEQKARTAMNSVTRFAAHWWWVLGAAVLSAIVLTMGIRQLLEPGMPYLEGTIQALTVGSLLAAGVILKAKMPRTAAALIAVGASSPATLYWAPIVMALGILVLLGSTVDLVRRMARNDVVLGALTAVGVLAIDATMVGYVWVGFDAGPVGLLWFAGAIAGAVMLYTVSRTRPPAPVAPAA